MRRRLPYPHLRRLLGAYVHQDWDVDGPTPDGAIRRFAREVGPEDRAGVVADVGRLLARTRTEEGLDRALDRMGCGYQPGRAGTTARAWLEHVREVLEEAP